jgi:hypothetical protein
MATLNNPINVAVNEDGSFTLSWDEKNPSTFFLNQMNNNEIKTWFIESIKQYLNKISN